MTAAVSAAVSGLKRLRAEDLRALKADDGARPAVCPCLKFTSPGWESVAAPLAAPAFECVGTLQAADVDNAGVAAAEPTLTEWHPAGTTYWSAAAPIAVDWFPCNRCTVWRCGQCQRGFLQYTEFGGYYVDHRLRPVDPALVV